MTLILFPQMFNPQVVKLYCMCLRTMKLWSRWSLKEEVQQWDMFPELIELLLIGLFDRINLDPKIQIKYIDTKNQLADILTKGNFTREEWNHLLTLFNISHFQFYILHRCYGKTSSTRIRRRPCHSKNHDLSWIWPQRTPSFVSSSASSNPGRSSHGYQDPGKTCSKWR